MVGQALKKNHVNKKCRQRGITLQEVVSSQLQSLQGQKSFLEKKKKNKEDIIYLPSLIESQVRRIDISTDDKDMDRRKRTSLCGPISAASAVDYSRNRVRSATKSRGRRGNISPEKDFNNPIVQFIDPPREEEEKSQVNSLSLDNWISKKNGEIEPPATENEPSSEEMKENTLTDLSQEKCVPSQIEIKDIEDSVESNLYISIDAAPVELGIRPKGTPLSLEIARSLRQFLFQSNTHGFSTGWLRQGFEFNPPGSSLSYGLKQRKGGPCGIIAAVQAYILKYVVFEKSRGETKDPLDLRTLQNQREALLEAMAAIFSKVSGSSSRVTLVTPGATSNFSGIGNYYKSDGITERLQIHSGIQKSAIKKHLKSHLSAYFENDAGIICFLYSVLMTKGLEEIKKEMDSSESPFIGAHGYCTQEMVNLLLTGTAASNTFDGSMNISDGIILKGITSQSQIGFLSLFEHYGSISVGSHYKEPIYPIWIICSESHFSLLFSLEDPCQGELFYYDELAKQEGPIQISLSQDEEDKKTTSSPIEKCIRTKWKGVGIEWKGSEPLL